MQANDGNLFLRHEREKGLDAYPALLDHILSGNEFGHLIRSAERSKHQARWRDLIRDLARLPPSSEQLSERFHTSWHVCHHFLRELVEDDDLLVYMLWVWLPRYLGPGLFLYRCENIDRFAPGGVNSQCRRLFPPCPRSPISSRLNGFSSDPQSPP